MATISAHFAAEESSAIVQSQEPWEGVAEPEHDSAWLIRLLAAEFVLDAELEHEAPASDAPARDPQALVRLFGSVRSGPDGKQLVLDTTGLTHVDVYADDKPLGCIMVFDGDYTVEAFAGIEDGAELELWGFADDDLVASRTITA